jgi:hypothetical protein
VREMIVSDLRGFLDLGAHDRAHDLLLVLRLFLSEHPGARRAPPPNNGADVIRFVSEDRCRPRLVRRSREVDNHGLRRGRTDKRAP